MAWNCDLSPTDGTGIVVRTSTGTGSGANIFYGGSDTRIRYGAWALNMNTSFAAFSTVQDDNDPEAGPAYHFQQYYEKVVVVPQSELQSLASTATRRNLDASDPLAKRATGEPAPGDRFWMCIFNSTFVEGFIYADRTAVLQNSTSSSTASVTLSTATPSTSGTSFTATRPNAPTATSDEMTRLEQYPLLVKIEERRLPNNDVEPYCQQYQVLDDLQASWVGDVSGNPIILPLSEMASTNSSETCRCQYSSGRS